MSSVVSNDDAPLTVEEELQKYKLLFAAAAKANHAQPSSGLLSTRRGALTTASGRGQRHLVSLYSSLQEVVLDAELHSLAISGDLVDDLEFLNPEQVAAIQRDRACHYAARIVIRHLDPDFEKFLVTEKDPTRIQLRFSHCERRGNDARAHDTRQLKEKTAEWFNARLVPPNPLLSPDSRANRGIQHDFTGRLLCPVTLDWDDLEVRSKIRAGNDPKYSIGTNFFCRFLFEGFEGSIFDIERGYLRSGLMIKAFKLIFTSPASARGVLEDREHDDNCDRPGAQGGSTTSQAARRRRAGRNDVAALLQMKTVTPRAIAYVAAQVHFALSSAPVWTMEYEGFNYKAFYHFIIDFFETASGPAAQQRVRDLLAWWNKMIFPQSSATAAPSTALSASLDALNVARNSRE